MSVNYKQLGLVNTREMFKRAINGGWAVPAFNFNNMEQLQAIIKASSEQKSPVILQVSKGARNYANATHDSSKIPTPALSPASERDGTKSGEESSKCKSLPAFGIDSGADHPASGGKAGALRRDSGGRHGGGAAG